MPSIVLSLPSPPSTNVLYRNVKGVGRVKSSDYKDWIKSSSLMVSFQHAKIRHLTIETPVSINVRVGDCNVMRDLDNHLKPLADILVHTGIIRDDNMKYVSRISAEKAFGQVKAGWVEITISHIPEDQAA